VNDKTYALSLYVDLRLGLIDDQIKTPEQAERLTAQKYGRDFAAHARWVCSEDTKAQREA